MPVDVRTVTDAEVPVFQHLIDSAFGGDPDPAELATWRPLVEPDRTLLAWDGDAAVGCAAVFTVDMTVPGTPVPAAAVTGVAVASTHRRQGLLRTMMGRVLDDVRERGAEPFATLWASEASIYGRFGYGVASRRWSVTVHASDPALLGRPPAGRVRHAGEAALRDVAPGLYDAVRAGRPGMISRSRARWDARLSDLPSQRGGASAMRIAVYDDAGGRPAGYALYRTKGDWSGGRADGTVRVKEVVALDADAHAGLWRYLLGVDLMTKVSWDNLPADDPLFARLPDPRAMTADVTDGLYVRLLDVPAALAARRYPVAGRVTFEVHDPAGYAAGRWTLDASPDGAECVPATESADVSLSVADLGAAYLGDTTLLSLYDAGRVDEHTPGAVLAASELLRWHRAAWCPEIF
jgi:predicted acetyltransferase